MECFHPELSTKEFGRKFVPYPHDIIHDFKTILGRKDLSVTSDLTINSSHVPISVAINDSLTKKLIFIENRDPKWLIEELVEELVRWQ